MYYIIKSNYTQLFNSIIFLCVLTLMLGCDTNTNTWQDLDEEGSFLIYRRQSLIGEETFSITSDKNFITVKSLQGENERGRITGTLAELKLDIDLNPMSYNCLLYTSPSPRDLSTSRMPSSA